MKEATARIKINKLLEAAGWRFFGDGNGPVNIRLESSVVLKSADLDALGDYVEKPAKGFVDFLLLDEKGFPLIGRPAESGLRELAISRSRAGYLARYRYDEVRDEALVLAIRHPREAGFLG